MSRAANQLARPRLVRPALTAALVAVALGGLGALHLWAHEPGLKSQASGDELAVALLRAEVDRLPGDVGLRCRLAREQLALGLYPDAERTLRPLVEERSPPTAEAAFVSLEIALGAWRAARPESPERRAAEAKAVRRIEGFLGRDARPGDLPHLATVARELGRMDLAARALERAAALETEPGRAMALGLDAIDAYRAADSGAHALRLADSLVERFPAERAVLERAAAIALAQNDSERARRFGESLIATGSLDPVSLGRQLDLDLAAGDLAGALQTAERLATQMPDDPRAQLTAAKVAMWAGRLESAKRRWMWLAKRGDAFGGIDQALALARATRDDTAIAWLLMLRSRKGPLSSASLAELADALESTAPPRTAVAALEQHVAAHPGSRAAWDALAAAQERRGGFAAALATRLDMVRKFGSSPATSLVVARLHWAAGHGGDALAELERFIGSAKPDEVEYWDLLAELAWQQEADGDALRAYGALWDTGRIDAVGAERLFLLARGAGRTDDAIRFGREGFSRVRQPRLLLLAMDEAARAGRWHEIERMAGEAAAGDALAAVPAYWMLRARADEKTGKTADAIAAYHRALAADARSPAARSGLIWLLVGTHQRNALSQYLAAWAVDAREDPGLWRAYAAGLEELRGAPASASRPAAAGVGAELSAETIGSVVLEQQRVFLRSEFPGAAVEARAGLVAYLSNGASLPVPGIETRVSARSVFAGFAGQTEVAAGMSLRADRNLLQGALLRTQALGSLGEVRLEASLNEPADESLPLRMEAVRTRLGGAVAVAEGRAYQRIAYDWKSWSTRGGAALGKGGAAAVEIGWRTQSPEVVVRLQGGYQRNRLAPGALPPVVAAFAADASSILPKELAAAGVGAGVARLPLGPVRLTADAWLGSVWAPVRPAFRVLTALAITPFRNGELALSGFAANDRWATGGNAGLSVSLTHRFAP